MGWLKDRREEREASHARKRAEKSSTMDLNQWVDVCLGNISRGVRNGSTESLQEASFNAEILNVIIDEIRTRSVRL